MSYAFNKSACLILYKPTRPCVLFNKNSSLGRMICKCFITNKTVAYSN